MILTTSKFRTSSLSMATATSYTMGFVARKVGVLKGNRQLLKLS